MRNFIVCLAIAGLCLAMAPMALAGDVSQSGGKVTLTFDPNEMFNNNAAGNFKLYEVYPGGPAYEGWDGGPGTAAVNTWLGNLAPAGSGTALDGYRDMGPRALHQDASAAAWCARCLTFRRP